MASFPFQIVGFDLDGTLLDTGADLGLALNHALASAGRAPVPLAQVRDLIGGGARMMLDRGLARTGGVPPPDEVEALYAVLIAYYRANIAVHTRPYPGTEAMLDDLADRGVALAVVTNKAHDNALLVLDALGLTARFATILGGDTLGRARAKPAPDLLLEMHRRLGGGPAAFVGDTTYDTRAAAAAGMPCVAVSFGFNDAPADALGATAVIDHYDALVPTLANLAIRVS